MKKSDIYEIAIKILGLYLIVLILTQLRDILNSMVFMLEAQNNPEAFGDMDQTPIFIGLLIPFLFLIFFSWLFIFRTKRITKLIGNKNDYKETAKLFAERETIYEIALILVGLVTIVLTLPEFIYRFTDYIQSVKSDFPTNDFDTNYLITSGLKIAVGLIAIIYSNQISTYLANKKNEELT